VAQAAALVAAAITPEAGRSDHCGGPLGDDAETDAAETDAALQTTCRACGDASRRAVQVVRCGRREAHG
jgi:hypothetical protein